MKKKRLLMIDDNVGLTELVKSYFQDTGEFEVETVNHGTEGLSAAKRFRPDIILLDVMMPDKMGNFVADEIKKHNELKETPIIFMTAVVDKEEIEASHGLIGGQVFLSKPVPLEELKNCVLKHIRKS